MYDDLIKYLREWPRICVEYTGSVDELHDKAADAIEQLIEERDAYRKAMTDEHNRAAKLAWEKEHCWIPVTERLPEDRHDVLVYAGVMFPYITVGYYDGLWKFSFNDEEIAGSADYWMPLPPAPKEET